MSINKHTDAVILELITAGDKTNLDILCDGIADASSELMRFSKGVYYMCGSPDLEWFDFRTELHKLLLEASNFSVHLKSLYLPDGLEAGIDKLIDAIIKDMHIEEQKN